MIGVVINQKISLWKQVLLALFLVDIMLIYPLVNRVQESSFSNRLLLVLLVFGVFLSFYRPWLAAMTKPRDIGSVLLISYLVWIMASTFGSIAFGIQSPGSFFTYGLNSFAPLILYGCFVGFPARRFLIGTILGLTVLNILIGIVTFKSMGLNIPGISSFFAKLIFDPDAHRLVSIIGKSTVVGYLSVFSFAWILFFYQARWRYVWLLFFGFAVLLSFQRSMWGGILLAFVLYMIFARVPRSRKLSDIAIIGTLILITMVSLGKVLDFTQITKLVLDRVEEFNFEDIMQERAEQQLLLNTDHWALVLVGEGYGKYSPLNKAENELNLPDAPYHMIFNETGLIGFSLFVGMLAAFLLRAVRRGNVFQIWFILHLGITLLGSRILWYFPLNFLVLIVLATLKDDRKDQSILPK